jgi:hypothetical protein
MGLTRARRSIGEKISNKLFLAKAERLEAKIPRLASERESHSA